ncbi:MAG: hypothetical protein DRH08_08895 [Deltaproteobacteria bacterium]|nr:MAG: hypothetical protein DRH08_08895 [Deltaproteobacteria bacterium]
MTIFDSPEGSEFRKLLSGDHSDRALAHLAGDYFTSSGDRVGLELARAHVSAHAALVLRGLQRSDPPEVTARGLANLEGFTYDGRLHAAIVAETALEDWDTDEGPARAAGSSSASGTLGNATPAEDQVAREIAPEAQCGDYEGPDSP